MRVQFAAHAVRTGAVTAERQVFHLPADRSQYPFQTAAGERPVPAPRPLPEQFPRRSQQVTARTLPAWYAGSYYLNRVVSCLRNWKLVSQSYENQRRHSLEQQLNWQYELIAWLDYCGIPTHFVRSPTSAASAPSPPIPNPWPIFQQLRVSQLNHFG